MAEHCSLVKFPVDNEAHTYIARFPAATAPPRLLFGPGPANVDPRVMNAITNSQFGHLDPYFVDIMTKIQELLRYTWQTKNTAIIPASGTGSCAMEGAVVNMVEEGEKVLVMCNGYFSERLAIMAERCGGNVVRVKKPWGTVFSFDEIKAAMDEHKPKHLCLVHAETSTGACQPLEGLGPLCRDHNAYIIVDTVTSMAGIPVFLDQWQIDTCYSGTQKCVGAPPGLAPLTFSARAMEKIRNRKKPVQSWYMDITLITNYWTAETKRAYHHTAPVSLNFGLYEALRIIAEEGLENRWKRHRDNAELLWKGLEALGLSMHVEYRYRLPTLTTVKIPDHIDGPKVQSYFLTQHNIEISGGLGELAGKVWRIGLMGYNSKKENVELILGVMKEALAAATKSGHKL